RPAGARLLVPEGEIAIVDQVSGFSHWDVAREVGDFLIAKRDKAPAYQLAVVVDDAAQGVTEVLRGDDLLPSAARQWHVQNALGLPHPSWYHVPLVTDASGRRLAKREADLSLAELCARGCDPRAIVAWVAASAGIDVGARVTAAEVTPHFDLARLPRAPLALDLATLQALKATR
ncbi:MAG: glutamate--tRNA ligase family protein, partial [Polyangiaceae bacterium]